MRRLDAVRSVAVDFLAMVGVRREPESRFGVESETGEKIGKETPGGVSVELGLVEKLQTGAELEAEPGVNVLVYRPEESADSVASGERCGTDQVRVDGVFGALFDTKDEGGPTGRAVGVGKPPFVQRSGLKQPLQHSPWLGSVCVGRSPVPTAREAGKCGTGGAGEARVGQGETTGMVGTVFPSVVSGQDESVDGEAAGRSSVSVRVGWARLLGATQGSCREEIDGRTLTELFESMRRFLTSHFESDTASLVTMLDEACRRLQWGTAVSDPAIARLLDEFGERSNAFMNACDRGAADVMGLDHGFQKAAGMLRGQIGAMPGRSFQSRSACSFWRGGVGDGLQSGTAQVADSNRHGVDTPISPSPEGSLGGSPFRKLDHGTEPLKTVAPFPDQSKGDLVKLPQETIVHDSSSGMSAGVGGENRKLPDNLAIPTNKTEMENRFFSAFLDRRRSGIEE